jgi:hypothetical protein
MKRSRKEYRTPSLVEYGSIGAHTFSTPGGHVKGCTVRCNLDAFNETAGRPDFVNDYAHPAS